MNLVTGANGHIGNVLVRALLARGEKVRAFVLPDEDCTPLKESGAEIVPGDVLDPHSIKQAVHGVNRIYHLAGIISIMPGKSEIVHQVNVQGTRNILRAAFEGGVSRLIYTSSIHALYRAPHGITIDEKIPFDPDHAISAYDQSKAEASLLVQDAACMGMDAVIACPTGVIGPYDYRGSEMGHIFRDAIDRKPLVCVDGAYDFVDVRDVADGLIRTAERGRRGESYILSGERISLFQIFEQIRRATGLSVRTICLPINMARFAALFTPLYYRLTRQKPRLTPYSLATIASNSVISHAKAHQELGYSPRSLTETIRDTVIWYKTHYSLHIMTSKSFRARSPE